jgi:septal ring factor EnvC (AmiA/AmiB activator)
MGGVISQKTEQQTDVEFFAQYKESLQASVDDIDDLIDALKKMMISEVTEDYVGKNAIETILNNILSELSKIAQILVSDFSNEAYRRLVAHHKYLVELAGELQEGIGSVEFPPSDNSEEIANCEEQIKTITTQIASTNSQIFTITEEIVILDNEISGYKVQLQTYKVDYSTAQENIEVIETSGILQFEAYMPINEVNFDCWSEQLIIDAVGYEDRGECSLKSYTEYTAEADNYKKIKKHYDELIKEQSELMTQVAQFKTNIADLMAARASKQTELDRLKSEDPNSPLIPVLEEEIKQLDRDIEDFTAQLSQIEADLSRTNERIQIIIDSGDLDFVAYIPVNEVNFDCWTETKLYNELNVKIESITNTVGYDERGKCSSDKYAVYLEEVAKYESKKSHYDSNIEERDSVKINIDELESDIDTLETELVILNNDRLYKVSIGESIEELQKTISDKEAELSGKKTDLTILRDRYSLAIEEIKVIEDSSDLEFVAYMPANEINFDCWTEQQIIDAVGYEDRGDCSEALYEEYVNIIKTSNDFYNKSLVPPSSWDALDLPDSISYKDLSLYMNKSVEFRDNQVIEFNQTLALYDSELTKYQAILDPLKVIENPTEEQLAEINGLEKIIKLLNAKRERLISDNNADEKLYIELTKWFSDNIDYWNNSEYKVILETYGPANEVNFNCYVNNLQNDKIDKLIEDNEYKIYNIESQLNNSSLDNEGTFNYYPNVYDDFSGNPKFSVGNFDELDSIINLSSNDLITWGKLVCNGGVGGTIMKNLITSVRCIESLKNEITSIEAEESNDFGNLKHIYESEIQNLRSQQQSDPRLTTDLLEVKLSNMINERSVNSDLNAYMVDKLGEVLEIYKQVKVIADDFCDNGGA